MRELKFRVYDKDLAKYLEGCEIDSFMADLCSEGDGRAVIIKQICPARYTFEQYTGIKDKNGKEIYEGDIVSVRNKNRKNEYDIGVVEFGKAAFRCPFLLGKYHSGQVEVIGNIHENDDLLDEKELKREELKAAVKESYEQGYHKGYADACDAVALASTETITSVVTKLKEMGQKAEAEVVNELES